MGATKKHLFSVNQNLISNIAKAYAHHARIAIIEYLLAVKSAHADQMLEYIPLAQATVSQHLEQLQRSGII
ncbi:winged helix-turn-helix domain-containing protein [Flavobacterium sp.]|uniref:ArsR/SmtB family transcription factor n=1 Tax=Flavobacterium sp. TaxID=239 RepID=UPI002619590E|nr:winged helix-turn-helix domain-containing protein [Flavobacterium sp.]